MKIQDKLHSDVDFYEMIEIGAAGFAIMGAIAAAANAADGIFNAYSGISLGSSIIFVGAEVCRRSTNKKISVLKGQIDS